MPLEKEGESMFTVGLLAGLFIGLSLGSILMSLLIISKTSPRYDLVEMEREMLRTEMPGARTAYPLLAPNYRVPNDTTMV